MVGGVEDLGDGGLFFLGRRNCNLNDREVRIFKIECIGDEALGEPVEEGNGFREFKEVGDKFAAQ